MNLQLRTTILFVMLALTALAANATVQRTTSEESYSPLIVLSVAPPAQTTAYAVEETLLGNALPTQINQNGTYDAATGKIKWGPFLDEQSRTFSYRVSGPAGSLELNGRASYNGTIEAFANDTLTLPDPNTTFYGYQYQNQSPRDFIQFPLDASSSKNGGGASEFSRYAFGVDSSNLVIEYSSQTATLRAYISSQAVDTSYTLEASTNLSEWEPISDRLPGVTLTNRSTSSILGVDELIYSAFPLDKQNPLLIRLRATWLATPIE